MTLTIDFGAIAHRIRVRWWRIAGRWLARAGRCSGCGKLLNAIERHYYETSCERCEGDLMRAVEEAHR